MKKSTIAMMLALVATATLITSAFAKTNLELEDSIKSKFATESYYSMTSQKLKYAGEVHVRFENGKYSIVKSGGRKSLDDNAAKIAESTLKEMTSEEKLIDITVPVYFFFEGK